MEIARELIEQLIYGVPDLALADDLTSGDERDGFDEGLRRYTQDSPVMPDVWIEFGKIPDEPVDLLATPRFGSSAGQVTRRLLEGLGPKSTRSVAYNQTYVYAELRFDEVVRVVLPLTRWWQEEICPPTARLLGTPPKGRKQTFDALAKHRDVLMRGFDILSGAEPRPEARRSLKGKESAPRLPGTVLWAFRLIGTIAWAQGQPSESETGERQTLTVPAKPQEIVDGLLKVLDGMDVSPEEDELTVWQINLNRQARVAVTRSTPAVKADAARLLFEIQCRNIGWAIIDSGIDASHPAFWDWRIPPDATGSAARARSKLNKVREAYKRSPTAGDAEVRELKRAGKDGWTTLTRVKETYDFTRVRELLDPKRLTDDKIKKRELPDFVKKALDRVPDGKDKEERQRQLRELARRLKAGWRVDWSLARPFLEVPHDETYTKSGIPRSEHGTHVAGILGADWPNFEMEGMCPDIKLYDLRVLKPGAPNDEFSVLAALQFVNHLNDQKDYFAIHGVNVSLAIRHDVANFACGRTPVCDECERLVSSGVVVVAAAGNAGYLRYKMADGSSTEGYHTVSITDPGNAAKVITVGATHRYQPHTYGVSYFSSRGPTGDGRIKPDLVAPGEKINAPIPNEERRVKDGTSMAAPHVSGAAAMLLARYSEFIGQPDRVKQVLCDTATDLGRERYFQGAGMLDALRALQSV